MISFYKSVILAIEHGHKEIVKLLVKNGADINAKTDKGFTGLMIGIIV